MDDLFKMWSEDSGIDKTRITDENLNISKLQNKYLQLLTTSKLKLRALEEDFKKLYLLKNEYFRGSIADEDLDEQGWEPNPLKILRSDVAMYIDADDDIIKAKLKIAYQKERVDFLESVIRSINSRSFIIRAHIDWEKFTSGY
jgi:hypothetical protein